jgi:hypothetical protein
MSRFNCNIDQTGKKYRLRYGSILLMVAAFSYFFTLDLGIIILQIAQGILALVGLFMIFEGIVGWCAIRAMGFKTRI